MDSIVITIMIVVAFGLIIWEMKKTREFLHYEICTRIEELKQDIFSPLIKIEDLCDDEDDEDDDDDEEDIDNIITGRIVSVVKAHPNITCLICEHTQCLTCSGEDCFKCGVKIPVEID